MPTFEDALIIIKEASETQIVGADDFFQDCCVAVLENGDFSESSVKAVCQKIRKKLISARIKAKCTRHVPKYTDDGECLDDNRIFIENPWEEESVGSRIPADVKAKMKSLASLVEMTVLLGKAAFHKNLFITTCCIRSPKKVFKNQDLTVLLKMQRLAKVRPCNFRNQQVSQSNHKELFYMKKGKKEWKK